MGKKIEDLGADELLQLDIAISVAMGLGAKYITQCSSHFSKRVWEMVHKNGQVLVHSEAFKLSCRVKDFSQYLAAVRINQLMQEGGQKKT